MLLPPRMRLMEPGALNLNPSSVTKAASYRATSCSFGPQFPSWCSEELSLEQWVLYSACGGLRGPSWGWQSSSLLSTLDVSLDAELRSVLQGAGWCSFDPRKCTGSGERFVGLPLSWGSWGVRLEGAKVS